MKFKLILLPILASFSFSAVAEINAQEILGSKCSKCHDTPTPSKYSKSEWSQRVDKMSVFAKLNAEEKQAVKDIKK